MLITDISFERDHYFFCNVNVARDKYNLCATFQLCLMTLRLKKEMKIH